MPASSIGRAAQESRKNVICGAEVIVLQAVEQFVLYTGMRPNPATIANAASFAHGPDLARLIGALSQEKVR